MDEFLADFPSVCREQLMTLKKLLPKLIQTLSQPLEVGITIVQEN